MSTPTINVSDNSGKGEGWKLVTSGTKRKVPAPPNCLQLQNRVTMHKAEEKPGMPTSKEPDPPNVKLCKSTRKKRQVIRVGDSLLLQMEAPMCQPNQSSAEVCCLPGTRVSGTSWRDCQNSPSFLDYYTSCSYFMWAQMILPRETWTV